MKLLEYEAKTILKSAGIPVPVSTILRSSGNFTGSVPCVLKSQVPVGGRGKAGGIRIAETKEEALAAISELFPHSVKGYLPHAILAEEKLPIQHEYYLSLLINKEKAQIQLMAHRNGGVEVEENDPDSFLTLTLNGTNDEPAGEKLAEYYELPGQSFALQAIVKNLYSCFVKNDMTLLEINPLVYTGRKLIAGDCKMMLDDAARFRHPDWDFEDKPADTNFVTLNKEGNVATIANGAGLAMATVDAVTSAGLTPANFLDIGGGANSESVLEAFKKIMEYSHVKAIVINIFAGITRCDEVAKAIIEGKRHIAELPPLYIRLAGTNVDIAKELLAYENIPLLPTLESCLEAAKQEVTRG